MRWRIPTVRRAAVRTSGVPPFLLLLLAFSAIACGEPAKGPGPATAPGEWYAFEGTGNATGQRKTLALGPDRKVSVVDLTGSLLLIGQQRLGEGFRGEFMGYSDSLKGSAGWSVWTDSRGDKVFGELRGEPVGTGSRFTGTFLGGTGRYAGVTGEYSFAWQYVIAEEGGTIQGRIVDLRGRYRIAPASPSPSPR